MPGKLSIGLVPHGVRQAMNVYITNHRHYSTILKSFNLRQERFHNFPIVYQCRGVISD